MMSSQFPFCGDNDDEYYKNVLEQPLEFPDSEWKAISDDAIDLIKGLLDKDPQTRVSPDEAMRHKWLNDPSIKNVRDAPDLLEIDASIPEEPLPKTHRFGQKRSPSEILARIENRRGS